MRNYAIDIKKPLQAKWIFQNGATRDSRYNRTVPSNKQQSSRHLRQEDWEKKFFGQRQPPPQENKMNDRIRFTYYSLIVMSCQFVMFTFILCSFTLFDFLLIIGICFFFFLFFFLIEILKHWTNTLSEIPNSHSTKTIF